MAETSPEFSAVQIRPAVPADAGPLAEFVEPFVAEKKILPRTADELDDLVRNGFVAESPPAAPGGSPRIVGFAALEIYSPKLAEIRSLAVAAELQGRGIGRRLVAACLERAEQRRILEVMVVTSNEQFFRSCGFDFTLPGEKKALFVQTRES